MKLDLHVHTEYNEFLDNEFSFDINLLDTYIEMNTFDVIAITNHNLFNRDQFESISEHFNSGDCMILPGIEISLESGHILVIGDNTEKCIDDLERISESIKPYETDSHYRMSVKTFNDEISGKGFLLIPHYSKSPKVTLEVLEKINDESLLEKLILLNTSLQKSSEKITPVYFSDIRIGLSTKKEDYIEKSRFTYFDCTERNFSTIKNTLKKKESVSLAIHALPETFDILNGQARACTGINVLIGKRSSGKTFTLDHISETDTNSVLYIKQFDITKKCEEKDFKANLHNEALKEIIAHFDEYYQLLNYISSLGMTNIEDSIGEYIETLLDYAEKKLKDQYSQSPLFNYDPLKCESSKEIDSITKSLECILDAREEYKKTIIRYVAHDSLINLYKAFVVMQKSLYRKRLIIDYANNLSKEISDLLGEKSPVPQVKSINFLETFRVRYVCKKFNNLIDNWNNEIILNTGIFSKFKREVKVFRQLNKTDLKKNLGVSRNSSIDYLVNDDPIHAYIKSMSDANIKNGSGDYAFQLFFDYEVIITNDTGNELSGGQRAEYSLLNKLIDYKHFDMVLIDEMESSFDNPFLNTEIINKIKMISKSAIVFISTHNNNLGVSLKPDYYIYHKVNKSEEKDIFKHYCGNANDKYLTDTEGNKVELKDVLLETMEASEGAYTERGEKYESTNN